ncbi:T9SS type A sorting domain-containing protein [Geofilum rubicundum]|uniref:Secretion system C-terminal sorting domain-containing protein n=1 Tax=Geofilum rubicundum JCM 15548 TaxID=1236989 RepID=A0A0E9LZB7_9BACT|nr:T9SS type A sorting domain-containing protein [Geofilum rubicundum]GAO30220.1 hypothetical protein JCM15548_12478 [Geofilum rubicundum JCM 15548]
MVRLSQGSTQIYSYQTHSFSTNTLIANFNIAASAPTGAYDLVLTMDAHASELWSYDAITITTRENSPQLSGVSIEEASQGGDVSMTITGSNTQFMSGSSMVSLVSNHSGKTISAHQVTTNTNEELVAQFRFNYAHETGLYTLKLFNAIDGWIYLPDAFTLLAGDTPPEIVSASPATVSQGETIDIEITTNSIDLYQGTNLIWLAHENSIIESNSYTVVDPNTVNANFSFNIDYPTGVYDLLFRHETGIELSRSGALTLEAGASTPSLASSTPVHGKRGEQVSITIYGVNTHFNKNDVKNKIYLFRDGTTITPIQTDVVDNTTISALFDLDYGHPKGLYTLYLYNAYDGTNWLSDAFTVEEGENIPNISSVSPNILMLGATLDVEITGENIDFSQGTNLVKLTQDDTTILMNSSEAQSETVLMANFTISYGHPTGDYILSIINDTFDATLITDKTLIKRNAFYLKAASTPIVDVHSDQSHAWLDTDKKQLRTSELFDGMQLYNMQGQLLQAVENTNSISTSSLPSGYYILKLWKNKVFVAEKIWISE